MPLPLPFLGCALRLSLLLCPTQEQNCGLLHAAATPQWLSLPFPSPTPRLVLLKGLFENCFEQLTLCPLEVYNSGVVFVCSDNVLPQTVSEHFAASKRKLLAFSHFPQVP